HPPHRRPLVLNPPPRAHSHNAPPLHALTPHHVTEIVPDVAPARTFTPSCTLDSSTNPAATPFTFTDVTPPKPVPSTTTGLPAAALPGLKPVTVGTTTKFAALVAVPPAVTTDSFPIVAAAGTVAVIW